MRIARAKVCGAGAYYHVVNWVAGNPGWLPFGEAEKERFVWLMRRLARLYTVDIISYSGSHSR